ncbi:Uncharacterised protein [Vibrio cholerae]|nr:Uncharacterised protein [Vibrio cholerae]
MHNGLTIMLIKLFEEGQIVRILIILLSQGGEETDLLLMF